MSAGTITTIEIDPDIDAICADDVNFENTPINRMIDGQPIFGTFLIARVDENYNYTSLYDSDIDEYLRKFASHLVDISKLVSDYDEADRLGGEEQPTMLASITEIEDIPRADEIDTFTPVPVVNQQLTLFWATPKDIECHNEIQILDESLDANNGQIDMRLQAVQDDLTVGTIAYSIYQGIPNIGNIEVLEGYRRQGIGTKMVRYLQEHFPDTEIEWGMTTDDGVVFHKAVTFSVENEDYTAAQSRLNEVNEKLVQNETDWNDLTDEQQTLENELRELHPQKTYIRLLPMKKVLRRPLSLCLPCRNPHGSSHSDQSQPAPISVILRTTISTLMEQRPSIKITLKPSNC